MFDFKTSPPAPALAVGICVALAVAAWPLGGYWPASMALPVLAYLALAQRWGTLQLDPRALARGRPALRWVALFAAASTLALLGWHALARPDLSAGLDRVPPMPPPLLPVAAVGFAMVNAALEEALFRGIAYDRLRAALGAGPAPHVLQAALFGLAHWSGIPSGPAGVVLAGTWGLGLSLLRERSGGLLAPWIAHVAADICIFVLVLGW